jgi:uncharacterized Zn finger protein (UPF0148 family)
MNKKTKCDHVVGYIESNGYDGDIITEFIHATFYEISTAKKLKYSDGCLYSFCPYCGKKLEGVVDKRVEFLELEKQKRDEEERVKREKAEKILMDKVIETSIKTKLNQLPDDGNFVVVFQPTKSSYYTKDVVINGTKDLILRNCVHYNQNKSTPDELIIKEIYRVMSMESFSLLMSANGWVVSPSGLCTKKEGNKKKEVSLDNGGIVYITERTVDEDGEYCRPNYDMFAIHRLGNYLGVNVSLETITLNQE